MTPLYFDYAATTPADPAVAAVMAGCLTLDGTFGNPASRSHRFGWQAEQVVEHARRQLADLLGADPREIVWTSGATESNNLALKGVVEALRNKEPQRSLHIITSVIEHKAVLDTCAWLLQQGVHVTYLCPDADGLIQPQQVAEALRDDTCLVSLMAVNNELGTITDIAGVAAVLKNHAALLHVDAAQAIGKVPVHVQDWGVDLLSVSAHKFYGPKGIGALYVRREPQVLLAAQLHGGGHERGMRSGTLPTHPIAGMGKAFELAGQGLSDELTRLEALRERFLGGLESLSGVHFNGSREHRVSGIVNLSFEGVEAESLMLGLRQVAVSSGSACASATVEPSFVLRGIGVSDELAHRALRFSFGRFTTDEEIDFAVEQIVQVVSRLRSVR